jgi:hypothetical protein
MARRYSLGITATKEIVECSAKNLDDTFRCKLCPSAYGRPHYWNLPVERSLRQARGGVLLINEVCDVGGCTILYRLARVALEFGIWLYCIINCAGCYRDGALQAHLLSFYGGRDIKVICCSSPPVACEQNPDAPVLNNLQETLADLMLRPEFKDEKTVVILAGHSKELQEIFYPKSEEWKEYSLDMDSDSFLREINERRQRRLGQMQSHFSTTLMFEDWSDENVIDVILSMAAAKGEKFHEDAVVELRNSLRQLRAGRVFGNSQPLRLHFFSILPCVF